MYFCLLKQFWHLFLFKYRSILVYVYLYCFFLLHIYMIRFSLPLNPVIKERIRYLILSNVWLLLKCVFEFLRIMFLMLVIYYSWKLQHTNEIFLFLFFYARSVSYLLIDILTSEYTYVFIKISMNLCTLFLYCTYFPVLIPYILIIIFPFP